MWASLRAVIMCPGASNTKLCSSCANAPMRPGVTEDPVYTDNVPDDAVELAELLTLLVLLALDILKGKEENYSESTHFTSRKVN